VLNRHFDEPFPADDHHAAINTALNTPKTNIYTGLRACELLHAGMTPEQIAQGVASMADMPGLIAAARHELCPDTMRGTPAASADHAIIPRRYNAAVDGDEIRAAAAWRRS
jgi:hypothetical protein